MREGLMMDDYPLSLTAVVKRAERFSALQRGRVQAPGRLRASDDDRRLRAARPPAGRALWQASGCEPGDPVATLMWNQPEHLEVYYALPSMGAVLHTLNPRLHRDELSFIVNDAEDRAIIVDESLLECVRVLPRGT